MTTLCPCCRQPLPKLQLAVSLEHNSIAYGMELWPVQPLMAVFFKVLLDAYPQHVTYPMIHSALWGQREVSDKALMLYASRTRKIMRKIGGDLRNVWGEGYRLVLPAGGPVRGVVTPSTVRCQGRETLTA